MAAPTTRPGLFAGWRVDSGLRYRNVVQVVDYEAVRARAHLHWSPKDLHEKEVFFPPVEHIEFPLSNAAMKALKDMSDPEVEVKKKIYDRSLESGVLPYDIDIDAFPEDTPAAPPRHRLLEHGFTKGCPGCDGGHYRRNKACRERFDAIFPREAVAPPTPAPDVGAPKTPGPLPMPKSSEKTSSSPSTGAAEKEHWVEPETTEGPEYSPDELPEGYVPPEDVAAGVYALVTRQLTRNEVLSRPDALQAIRKEFDGVGSMGTWELESVHDEEFRVKEAALKKGETIHIADLLAICSEKHVELAPELRALKGRVCCRGDSAKTAEGKLALYQTLAASPASIVAANSVISFGLFEGHKLSSADAVKAYLQSELKSLAATYIRLPRELWPESWFTPSGYPRFKRPIIRLRKSLYGHPEAGAHWQQFLEEQLCLLGAVKVEEFASTFTIPTFGGLALVVYVDDLILSGPSQWHEPFWEALGEKVLIDDIGPLGRFLGRHHSTVEVDNTEFFGFDMRAYAEATVQKYLRVANSPKMKVVA